VQLADDAIDAIQAAMRADDVATAATIARQARRAFPQHGYCQALALSALAKAGAWQEVEALSPQLLHAFPQDPHVWIEHAQALSLRGEQDAALAAWSDVATRFPDIPAGHLASFELLSRLGRLYEASAAIAMGVGLCPGDLSVLLLYGRAALQRGDYPEAMRRWNIAARAHPDNDGLRLEMALARRRTRFGDEAARNAAFEELSTEMAAYALPDGPDIQLLIRRFDSIGSDCEFGFVKRKFGYEPVSLYRWAGTTAANIATMLESGLDGIGEPDQLALQFRGRGEEISIEDRRGYFRMHSWIWDNGDVDADVLHRKSAARLAFLKGKLIEDLAAGEKIFVHKAQDGFINAPQRARITAALRRFGPARALFMMEADAAHPPGTFSDDGDLGLAGYTTLMQPAPNARQIDYPSWLRVLRGVAAG
jgi:Flp pilus assembly protein TadD